MRFTYTESAYRQLSEDYIGRCTQCGAEDSNCEPDTRRRKCPACGAPRVYGLQELMIMGLIDIIGDEPDAEDIGDYTSGVKLIRRLGSMVTVSDKYKVKITTSANFSYFGHDFAIHRRTFLPRYSNTPKQATNRAFICSEISSGLRVSPNVHNTIRDCFVAATAVLARAGKDRIDSAVAEGRAAREKNKAETMIADKERIEE